MTVRQTGKDKLVSASEIATYGFCARAWYYRYVERQAARIYKKKRMSAGQAGHAAHARGVLASRRVLRIIGLLLLLALAITAFVWILSRG